MVSKRNNLKWLVVQIDYAEYISLNKPYFLKQREPILSIDNIIGSGKLICNVRILHLETYNWNRY
jgi:hypothetical protein